MRVLFLLCILITFQLTVQSQTSFTSPDTVCVGEPVSITNTSVGTSTYYWNFCIADINSSPTGLNFGNIGNQLSSPVFMDYAFYNNNYYGFVVNHEPGGLVRLNFGNSLLNTPTATNLGNFNGLLMPDRGSEGIQVVFNEGRWYAIIVTGYMVPGSNNKIMKLDFGPDLSNPAPVATNWGNVGNLLQPIDLHVFQEGANWYGLTVSAENNTITRFDFSSSFNNTPTAVNLGNIGNLSYPTGIYAVSDNSKWSVFITNAGNNTRQSGSFSLTRLDFGNSLLNAPTGVNLGNPGNILQHPRDLTIMKFCGDIVGFAVNGHSNNRDIVRLNFGSSLMNTPQLTSLGNIGNLSFPHSISKLFRIENDVYGFITNVDTKTVTRLRFTGCSGGTMPPSTVRNPTQVVYSTPGTYNINLVTDDGLPGQSAFCRNIVVVPKLQHSPNRNVSFCPGDSVLLTSNFGNRNVWNTGLTTRSFYAKTPGVYWVETRNGACTNVDTFTVTLRTQPLQVNLGNDTAVCKSDTLILNVLNDGATYQWHNGSAASSIFASGAGRYSVTVNRNGCSLADTLQVMELPAPTVTVSADTTICQSGEALLTASGGVSYHWSPATLVDGENNQTTTAKPNVDTKFYVTVTAANNCKTKDSVLIRVKPKPIFSVQTSRPNDVLCVGETLQLTASGGNSYSWSPSVSLSDPDAAVTAASPVVSTRYKVVVYERLCNITDSTFINVPVGAKPEYTLTKSNDIDCLAREANLKITGGAGYIWTPTLGLSDPTGSNPKVAISSTTEYHVKIRSNTGCEVEDSITVEVKIDNITKGFLVPNSFTPNNDGYNDCFSLKKWGTVTAFAAHIYNRWGQLVYRSSRSTDCWDGRLQGVDLPAGGYVYMIKAKTMCGDVFRKGIIMLVR
jgi:gliding motility-associated-like protein